MPGLLINVFVYVTLAYVVMVSNCYIFFMSFFIGSPSKIPWRRNIVPFEILKKYIFLIVKSALFFLRLFSLSKLNGIQSEYHRPAALYCSRKQNSCSSEQMYFSVSDIGRLGTKEILVLATEVEPKTFRLLVRMLYHWATEDSWELRPLN